MSVGGPVAAFFFALVVRVDPANGIPKGPSCMKIVGESLMRFWFS
jgi:hypothetical protein